MRFAIPLAVFVIVVAFLAVGLQRDPRLVPSPLIGKALPAFSLNALADPERVLNAADLAGEPYLLNVWASWCVACREEHPLLVELARRQNVRLIGMNYKDERSTALAWLARRGDPYLFSLFDPQGKLGLDLGVYGVPETFVVDPRGVIRYKHIGPLTEAVLESEVLPLIATLGKTSS